MRKSILMMSTAWGVLAMTGGSARAADAAPAAAPAPTAVGEIVVTAERREASLQAVPEAVTAFTARDRNIKGIGTVQEITDFTPGLTYSSQLDRPAIRGLAKNNNIYTSDSGVAIYYDDFYSNSTFLVGRDDLFIDQVEVLLGPQGTLYGRNAIGGLINTISKRPSNQFSGEVRAIAGNYGYTKFEGTVTGPIGDHFSFRLSGYDLNQQQGYFKNLVPGKPSEGEVRHDPYMDAQLRYRDDSNDIWLDANDVAFNHDRGGPGGLLGTPTAGAFDVGTYTSGQIFFNPNFGYQTPTGPVFACASSFPGCSPSGPVAGSVQGLVGTGNPALDNIRTFAHAIPTDIYVHGAYGITFHAVHHFDGFDVKYVTGYSQYHYHLNTALFGNDNSPVTSYQIPLAANGECAALAYAYGPAFCQPLTVNPAQNFVYETHAAWWSQELTFSSTTNNPVQWIGGLYYYHETNNNPQTVQALNQPQLANPVGGLPNPNDYYYFTDYQATIQSYAAYGQVDWKITPTLKLTGGFRFTYDTKSANEEARFIGFYDVSPGDGFGLGSYNGTPLGLNAGNLGSLLPALDITAPLINPAISAGKSLPGVTCAPSLATSGPFAGDWTRCLSDHSSAPTGTAGIEWTPDADTLVYVRYNRGYKAFGLNAGNLSGNPEAKPETVDDIEGGFKKTFGHTLTLDAAAFYYNYSNAQVPLPVPSQGINLTQFFNVPTSISEGVELTANWRPITHLDLSLTYGLDHTSIRTGCAYVNGAYVGACYIDTSDTEALSPGVRPVGPAIATGSSYDLEQAVNGNPLPQAPENKVAFNANYTWVFEPGNLTLSGTYIWRDKSYASVFTRSYDEAPSWSQVDMRAVWSGDHDRYEVVLYVKNLFNTLGYDAASTGYYLQTSTGYTQARSYDLTPPRLYGVELHYRF
jgi:iron complex outermembrane receptor protein